MGSGGSGGILSGPFGYARHSTGFVWDGYWPFHVQFFDHC